MKYTTSIGWRSRLPAGLCALCALLMSSSSRLTAQASPANPGAASATPVLMVEIQCKPGTANRWRDAFVKEILPSIQEAVQKGDVFTGFAHFEAPLPAQNIDFVLLFELKSFAALDSRRIPPHYEALFRRVGPERGEAVLKEMGDWEQHVTVSLYRSYKVPS